MKKLEEYVRSIPDFPEPGIIFRDVTSILQDADGLQLAVDSLRAMVKDLDYDVVVGPESRGFIFGVPVAYAEHKSFVPVRKKGKLPCETISAEYELEYGTAGPEGCDRRRSDRHRRHYRGDHKADRTAGRPGGKNLFCNGTGRIKGQREVKGLCSGLCNRL